MFTLIDEARGDNTMATITFRTKPETIYNMDDTVAYQRIRVPVFTRGHCDMSQFRRHEKLGGIANSDLFHNALSRIRRDLVGEYIRLDRELPKGVTVDTSGFLAKVSIEV
jgi:hypothetical protein